MESGMRFVEKGIVVWFVWNCYRHEERRQPRSTGHHALGYDVLTIMYKEVCAIDVLTQQQVTKKYGPHFSPGANGHVQTKFLPKLHLFQFSVFISSDWYNYMLWFWDVCGHNYSFGVFFLLLLPLVARFGDLCLQHDTRHLEHCTWFAFGRSVEFYNVALNISDVRNHVCRFLIVLFHITFVRPSTCNCVKIVKIFISAIWTNRTGLVLCAEIGFSIYTPNRFYRIRKTTRALVFSKICFRLQSTPSTSTRSMNWVCGSCLLYTFFVFRKIKLLKKRLVVSSRVFVGKSF